jgi:prolyl-tRNA synthetase
MMKDTKALQSGTSHNLGQNFARAFDIQYLDRNNELQYCWTTSWGLSTRFVGAIIMTHGDDQGLVLPPRLAPIQVVIVPIFRSDEEQKEVMRVVEEVAEELSALRVKIDDRTELTPGFKFNDWELRGVPVRIEIGPKDVENNAVVAARRDILGRDGKIRINMAEISMQIPALLDQIHNNMLEKATKFRNDHIIEPLDYETFKTSIDGNWALSYWCGSGECEAKIKEETKATIRCLPLDQGNQQGACILCGKPADKKAFFAKAY